MLDDTFTVAKDFGMSRQPAWVLSSICSKWRKIALSCKPLWSNICLDFKANTSFVCLTAVSPTISQLSAGGSLFKTGAVLLPNLQDLIIHSRYRRNLPSSETAPSSILDDTVLAEMVKSRWIPDTTIMNNSSRTILESLRADGLKFVVQVNPNEVEETSGSETDAGLPTPVGKP
ncbi:uncharacterized protein C8R40DRAFT_391569 [Lentinula edodes]|uniref:uncharacterized protein n=1 Tax=Lentinula edodes TaxID=5353 RepID=UPI001E8E9F09|nr:uncharacterized protein C8R40DRAFT_391569 [Lentinula edodes]KAH7873484.1 hypothetical protein C8R40DRAFT_391569 [Lentinula edodes]